MRMGVPDNLQVDGGVADTGCLHSGSVGGSRCGPSSMDTGGYRRIRQSGLIVRLTGLDPVTRASSPATHNKNLILYGASLNGMAHRDILP